MSRKTDTITEKHGLSPGVARYLTSHTLNAETDIRRGLHEDSLYLHSWKRRSCALLPSRLISAIPPYASEMSPNQGIPSRLPVKRQCRGKPQRECGPPAVAVLRALRCATCFFDPYRWSARQSRKNLHLVRGRSQAPVSAFVRRKGSWDGALCIPRVRAPAVACRFHAAQPSLRLLPFHASSNSSSTESVNS